MKNPCLKSRCFFSYFLHGILLSWMIPSSEPALLSSSANANESDHLALLDFKTHITQDPLQVMGSWNDSTPFCIWVGVKCGPSSKRVVVLNLGNQKLVGSIPPSIGNLTFLTEINLGVNGFHGELPQEIGRLLRLQILNFTHNSLAGKIPTNLTHCTELTVLDTSYNEFIGLIPDQLSSLSKLEILRLSDNYLVGKIPVWVGNSSSLHSLLLAMNSLAGNIPFELGQLSGLVNFQVYENYLSGKVPTSIYNISSLQFFSVAQNQLHGQLPPDVGLTLPNLRIFAGGVNNFSGVIPVSLSNASGLRVIDFANNSLTGTLPGNLGFLGGLIRLNFDDNKLGTGKIGDLSFLISLPNCTSLTVLGFAGNRFGGGLPNSIANLSNQLERLTLGENLIHGNIPIGIGNLASLSVLGLEMNYFTGNVPTVLGKLQQLVELDMEGNRFSGPIPSSLGNLTLLNGLYLHDNEFVGSIPPNLGNCQNLLALNLSSNNLSGTIPKQIWGISSLTKLLSMSHNFLSGSLPIEVGQLDKLEKLDLSNNKLSGEIPSSLGRCTSLESLHLEGNAFGGTIPLSLRSLGGIEEIDLSCNNLTDQFPDFLSKTMSLRKLNLSYNDFVGEVSQRGIFANASAISVTGNSKLCGGVSELYLPPCSSTSSGKHLSLIVISVVGGLVALIILLLCLLRNAKSHSSPPSSKEWRSGMSYSDIVKSTNGFSEENFIGSGSFGSVYKGIIANDGTIVAIKLLNLQQQGASKSFIDECNALRSVRHRNLLRLITVCSSVDHQGNDFKCLVFDFMSNGSLYHWLHPGANDQYQNNKLSLIQRLNIAIDVASALDYLHHQCETPIVHCDLKPSNVLIDENMTAHVGDFGLARFLFDQSNNPSSNQTMSVLLKGSIGYIPPGMISS